MMQDSQCYHDPDHVSLSAPCRFQLVLITVLDALSAPQLTQYGPHLHVIFLLLLLECGQTETATAGVSASPQWKNESEANGRKAALSSC